VLRRRSASTRPLAPTLDRVWPRTQRFVETLAGPITLSQAGVLLPVRAGGFIPRVASQANREVAPFTRALVAPVSPAPLEAEGRGLAFVARALPAPSRTSAPTPVPSRASTALGELAVVQPAPFVAGPRPGRLAQQAELLGLVAEQRVARQLGFPEPMPARSVARSADAFTVVTLGAEPEAMPRLEAPRFVEPAAPPRSVAALLQFADRQLGPRLLGAARPRPVPLGRGRLRPRTRDDCADTDALRGRDPRR